VVELNIAKVLYALALLSISLNYGIKPIFGIPDNVTWIDPTLILSVFIFCLRPRLKYPYHTLAIIFVAILSATSGYFLLHPEGQGLSALYNIYREPIKLTLNIIWFWVSINFLKNDRKFVLHWYAISVIIQFLLAIYFLLGWLHLIPLPGYVAEFIQSRFLHQTVYIADLAIPRLLGTFIESPPFGLFMFSAFVVFSLVLYTNHKHVDNGLLLYLGWFVALAGTLGSLSDQVFLGMFLFCGIFVFKIFRRRKYFLLAVLCIILLIPFYSYITDRLTFKIQQAESLGVNTRGSSVGERVFHAKYGIEILSKHPGSLLFGIGPGRYGDYAAKTNLFPPTVTPQVTIIEWLVGYGIVGCIIILSWLKNIFKKCIKFYGVAGVAAFCGLLIADMFQANWMWVSWFFAMAFLCVPYYYTKSMNW